MTSRGVFLIMEIVLFALGAMLSVWGVLRLARRQGGASGWLGSLQRALLGPAAALPLAAGLLAAVLGADAQAILPAALAGLLLGDGLAAWTLLRLPRTTKGWSDAPGTAMCATAAPFCQTEPLPPPPNTRQCSIVEP